jgi:hypothetical protein
VTTVSVGQGFSAFCEETHVMKAFVRGLPAGPVTVANNGLRCAGSEAANKQMISSRLRSPIDGNPGMHAQGDRDAITWPAMLQSLMVSHRMLSFVCIAALSMYGSFVSSQSAPVTKITPPTLRVFLLAGQSNMEGQAVVDLDHEQHYNGGRGTLQHVMTNAKDKQRYQHLRDQDGKWVTRSDVVVWYRARGEQMKAGPLSIGYAGYDGLHHFGPELQFGHVVGEHFTDPVLLIKAAWGGKSLAKDFLPPSATGETGPYYTRMIAEYREAIAAVAKTFPQFAKHKPELSGFVWFQGWNDMCDAKFTASYEANLVHLIRDVRRDLNAPELPIVVAETGNADHELFRAAQRAGVEHDDVAAPAVFVPTRALLRRPEDSPNTSHGHHWFGNAESYFLIGDAMGRAMLSLLK